MTGSVADASPSAPVVKPSYSRVRDALSPRAILCAIVLGCAICFANMYFGLQAGTVNAMPMQTALLGFTFFRSIRHYCSTPLSPAETTSIEVVAGALGLAPFRSGFIGLIPALEFLTTTMEKGPIRFSFGQLLVWSVATCCLGSVFAAPFRWLFIIRERLRYPSATATGTLIGVLFGQGTIVARAEQQRDLYLRTTQSEADANYESPQPTSTQEVDQTSLKGLGDAHKEISPGDVGHAIKVLLVSLTGSALFVSRSP